MTIWDKIYKNFQNTGEEWATIKEGLLPSFVSFIDKSTFSKKMSLDIGCGTGKYLVYLKKLGFSVSGIDSSETAVAMSKKAAGEGANIKYSNMFEFDIPENKYDLMYSISTIHHGLKNDVVKLIDQIYAKLAPGGKVFITLPDIESAKKWNRFKDNKEVGPGTYAPQSGPETGLAHSFFDKEEVGQIFSKFKDLDLELDNIGRWIITGSKN